VEDDLDQYDNSNSNFISGTTGNISGTTNQVNVSATRQVIGGSLTLSLPQNIHTSATPAFGAVTVNNTIPVAIAPATDWFFSDQTIFEYGHDVGVVVYDGTPVGLYWSNGDYGNNR